MRALAVITIGIDPEIQVGPVTLAWHGITIALGIVVAMLITMRWVRLRGLNPDPLFELTGLLAISGFLGGRIYYLLEHGGPLLGARGFTFDGGFILAGLVLVFWVRYKRLDIRYLDAIALWLPLGVAIGRVGDLINGEHYGAVSTAFYAVRNSSPNALTPDSQLAYENGGLFEIALALFVLAAMLILQRHAKRPGDLAWAAVGLFAFGRFFEFFLRSDSPELALGLSNAQWTSVALLVAAVMGRTIAVRRSDAASSRG